jgi:hypothetical protein
VTVNLAVTALRASTALVDVEIYDPLGHRVFQTWWDGQTFVSNQQRAYTATWSVPQSAAKGQYAVRIGIFRAGWGTLYYWNSSAAHFNVR